MRINTRLTEFEATAKQSKADKEKLNRDIMLHNYQAFTLDRNSHAFIQSWIKLRTYAMKTTVKKRDLKSYEKEAKIVLKYFEGTKPMHIA